MILRLCTVCRAKRSREELLRLTVDCLTGEVFLNLQSSKPIKADVPMINGISAVKNSVNGRSVYLCPQRGCVERALKGNRLKGALEGGRGRKDRPRRTIKWPLEPQLIHTLSSTCTES